MKLAEQIIQQLIDAGVKRIYGVVGDSLNPIVDAVRASGGSANGGIDWVHVRHEEVAAFAAGAEAQITGELAVCAGSCGPGNTHLINGLYDANRSHAPVLAIASHIPSEQIGTSYFQETHPERIFEDCSVYNEMAVSPKQTLRIFNSAMRHAESLRGVAVVTLPGDIASEDAVDSVPEWGTMRRAELVPDQATIQEIADRINKADKVAIFAGAGVAGAHDEVIALADAAAAPVGHSMRGKEFIQYDNPFDVGMTGLLGYGQAAEGMKDADLMLLLGTDFPYDQFLPDTETIQIDRAAQVMGRRTNVGLLVEGDMAPTLRALLPLVEKKKNRKWLKSLLKKNETIMTKVVGAYTKKPSKLGPIHPEYAASILDDVAAEDAIFTADTGMCNVWTARYITPNGKRRLLGSFLHGSMANALPQALGASVSQPGRQVISVSGDGGLSMLLGDLLTAKMYDLPLTVVVFNNSTLGMVKLEQLVQGFEDYGVDVPAVNYADIATAMGFQAERVTKAKDLEKAYKKALSHQGPSLVEVITDPNALSMPPEVESSQIVGFATSLSKIALNRGAGEAVAMAKSNWRNASAWRQF
ncbi:pyruvate dehydrogenase [Rothia aerolata]|uniref:Pyruvate dehydrogenase n=1 Tax=Rothia aerolata TaxID=1812262 RepID=A0A917IUD6_9MICC|nr:pyruvate dehydrogenase [Rothia aerolata]GGH62799.1 pyruvate dehydrogenase [Rothia aerolata]